MSDMRMAKYETWIEDIASSIGDCDEVDGNTALALIYDYDKCNDYAKVIMDKSALSQFEEAWLWDKYYPTYGAFKDAKSRIEASKKLVQLHRDMAPSDMGYKFIFWALMILTVDKTDAEEHLALICDFAQMFRITEDEFEDIIQTIKIVYNEVATEYVFKSESVPSELGALFNMYNG